MDAVSGKKGTPSCRYAFICRTMPLGQVFMDFVSDRLPPGHFTVYFTVTFMPFFTPLAATAYTVQLPFFFPLTVPLFDTDATLSSVE